jgi:hypothetical protein
MIILIITGSTYAAAIGCVGRSRSGEAMRLKWYKQPVLNIVQLDVRGRRRVHHWSSAALLLDLATHQPNNLSPPSKPIECIAAKYALNLAQIAR